MKKSVVSIVKYEAPFESVKKAVELADGFANMPGRAKVFIKPNIVFWSKSVRFPKWGVLTTSRVVEDIVVLLKEHGIDDITIGEGIVGDPKDRETPAHAFKTLGYETLNKKYGVKYINVFDRPFETVDIGDGIELNFNTDILNSDFVVDLPVMKTHNQTVVSLGIKNLKGVMDIKSRKTAHSPEEAKNLFHCVPRLPDRLPPILAVLDGIYTLERGPAFDGRVHRSNILVASSDVLSADMVGARIMGHEPRDIPILANAAANRNRPSDLSDIEVVGESIENVASYHEYDFAYHEDDQRCVPVPLARDGITGLFYRKYDETMCTYCASMNGLILSAIRYAWKGEPWDRVEVLTGKKMTPTPGMNKTILVGKCMYQKNRDNPDIKEMIPIKGCPPNPKTILKALHQAGIDADPMLFENIDQLPGFFMSRYEGKPEFDESFFQVS